MANYNISEIEFGPNTYILFDEQCRETLIDIIDTGPKNLIPDVSYGSPKGDPVPYVDIPILAVDGHYQFYADGISSDASSGESLLVLYNARNEVISDASDVIQHGDNVSVSLTISGGPAVKMRIYAADNTSGSEGKHLYVYRAMLCHKSLYDLTPAYVFHMSSILEFQNELTRDTSIVERLVDTAGVKNIIEFNRGDGTYTINGATYTVDSNTVTVSGTASSYTNFRVVGTQDQTTYSYGIPIPKGRYKLTGLPPGASSTTFRFILGLTASSSATRSSTSIYDDYEFTVDTDTTVYDLTVYLSTNYAASTPITFTPMICRIEEYNASEEYVAPAKAAAVLTSKIAALIDSGYKNLIDVGWKATETIKGVQWVFNSNGSVTGTRVASSTEDSTCYLLYGGTNANVPTSGPTRLSGCPPGGSVSTHRLVVNWTKSGGSTVASTDTGDGNGIRLSEAGTINYISCVLSKNQSGPVTFWPMLCLEEDWKWSKKFVKYRPNVVDLQNKLINLVDSRQKNIANWSASSGTVSQVIFTINSDGTVSTSGTASARAQIPLNFTVPSTFLPGRYVLSGCPPGGAVGSTVKYCLYVWDMTASTRVSHNDTGDGSTFDWDPDPTHQYSIGVDIRNGSVADGLTFKPMICSEADWAVSKNFVPYKHLS